jgi:UDP-N-acetylglucosamine 2-epimerase
MQRLRLVRKSYCLATIHRAENTGTAESVHGILSAFGELELPVILPIHPRTRTVLGNELIKICDNVRVIDPVSYLDMLLLEKNARLILTDSGGVQKEAYWLEVPCVTLRDETEWVETVESGWNILAGRQQKRIVEAVDKSKNKPRGRPPALYGDGHSAERICAILLKCHDSQYKNKKRTQSDTRF